MPELVLPLGLSDPTLSVHTLAATLAVAEETRRSLPATVIDYPRPRHLLLILDNCEHLMGACARIAETLLQSCPHLHILSTSREPLNIPGEVVWPVPPLSLPEPDEPISETMLGHYEAVRLFVDRAALGWALDSGHTEEAARLAGALTFFWAIRGYWTEGRHWLEAVLDSSADLAPAWRARVLRSAGLGRRPILVAGTRHHRRLKWRRQLIRDAAYVDRDE